MSPPMREILEGYYQPGMLLYWAASYFFAHLVDLFRGRRAPSSKPLSIATLRDEAFGKFWNVFSAERDETANPTPAHGSVGLIPPLLAKATGTVLDVGPGSGTQLPLFAKNPNVDMIYGAEPCEGLHEELARRVRVKGLEGRYRILGCGAQEESLVPALVKEGVLTPGKTGDGVFDTIVCVRVLCSVPSPRETVRGLYMLLKPGGKLIVVEHVKNEWRKPWGSIVARACQIVYTAVGWSFFLGDCALGRETEKVLLQAAKRDGGWGEVDLETSFGWSALPYVSGVLVKKGK